ncbi:hypothetical protein EJB05_53887, partial [Eragrostis curvula]
MGHILPCLDNIEDWMQTSVQLPSQRPMEPWIRGWSRVENCRFWALESGNDGMLKADCLLPQVYEPTVWLLRDAWDIGLLLDRYHVLDLAHKNWTLCS